MTQGIQTILTKRFMLIALLFLVIAGAWVATTGLLSAVILLILPIALFMMGYLLKNPKMGLYLGLIIGFFSAGIARYIAGPWGLALDVVLFVAFLGFLFRTNTTKHIRLLGNDVMVLHFAWFAYILLEIVNPQSVGFEAWFYAMRGIGFYAVMALVLTFYYVRTTQEMNKIIRWVIVLSVIGSLWGLRQNIFGVDAAEHRWLYEEEHFEEHVLFGVLRVFSFYSDAGQFGASQAMMALFCFILFLGPFSMKVRILSLIAALFCFVGFAISGTRGALAVPAIGGIAYLFMIRNFKILITGFLFFGIVFYILKFTFLFQGVTQVQRMRTALDPENPSLIVRLNNQKTFHKHLRDKPMGGGVGSAGFWGQRFAPNTLLAQTATDSWYVKIWAETGVIGISFHLFILGFIVGKAGVLINQLKNPQLRYKMIAMLCAVVGVLGSSYGNQVFGQMPTGMIMNLFIPLLFISKNLDSESI
jgi:hypothetical protein